MRHAAWQDMIGFLDANLLIELEVRRAIGVADVA